MEVKSQSANGQSLLGPTSGLHALCTRKRGKGIVLNKVGDYSLEYIKISVLEVLLLARK